MENYVIQEWEASYYCWETKAWNYGKLTLCSKYICFHESNSSEPTFAADLCRVTGFQRRLVSLIYRAVVVTVEGGRPLWVSSLQNREEVFCFLEHFWKHRLLIRPGEKQAQKATNSEPSSLSLAEKRQKLFEVLYDSENTLTRAGDSLFTQGEAVDHSSQTMNKMHRDLNVTETLLHGLDKWFTKWDIKPEHFYEIQAKKEHPILYRKNRKEMYYPGTLVLSESQVTVLSIKRVADISILLKDLTSVVVNTPWNILLVRSAIGEVDLMIDISSAQVVYILTALQHEHGHKFCYEDSWSDAKHTIRVPKKFETEITKQNYDVRLSEVDEADLETVSDVVGKMKSMAIGINQEMTRQLDSLDQLTESVDKANYRVQKSSRKVKEKL